MVHFLSEEGLATAQTQTHVELGELETALSFDLSGEVPNPRQKEDYIGEDDEREEEPLPFV